MINYNTEDAACNTQNCLKRGLDVIKYSIKKKVGSKTQILLKDPSNFAENLEIFSKISK